MRKFFNITTPYKFEWSDIGCISTILNVVLIIAIGLSASWFGLFINLVEIVLDLAERKRINLLLIHLSMVILNIYFLLLFYGKIG